MEDQLNVEDFKDEIKQGSTHQEHKGDEDNGTHQEGQVPLEELKDIAKFFQGREIDGKTVYGAAIYTERGSEGITMGVTNALYNYGFK